MKFVLTIVIVTLFISCSKKEGYVDISDVDRLITLMSGEFDNRRQVEESNQFSYTVLNHTEIWKGSDERWLYQEQAIGTNPAAPYIQRVIKLTLTDDGTILYDIFNIANKQSFVNAWKRPALFTALSKDSLEIIDNCSILIRKDGELFKGATFGSDCATEFKGASYLVSELRISEVGIDSWSTVFNDKDQAVWGTENAAYLFRRKKK